MDGNEKGTESKSSASRASDRQVSPQVICSNESNVVALASYTANTPVELRPPAARIDDRRQSGRRRVTSRDRVRIVELYRQGRSTRFVAGEVGVSKATVLTTLKDAGVERRPIGAHY